MFFRLWFTSLNTHFIIILCGKKIIMHIIRYPKYQKASHICIWHKFSIYRLQINFSGKNICIKGNPIFMHKHTIFNPNFFNSKNWQYVYVVYHVNVFVIHTEKGRVVKSFEGHSFLQQQQQNQIEHIYYKLEMVYYQRWSKI